MNPAPPSSSDDPRADPRAAGGQADGLTETNRTMAAQRPLGTISLASLVVANMIGAGVYTTSGFSLVDLQQPALVLACWAVAGVIALLGAFCYGGLAKGMAESGGEYLFLARGVHPAVGFMAGWISLTAGFSGSIAFSAKTFASYLPADLRDGFASPALWAVALVTGLTLVNLADLKLAARAQNLVVLAKLLALTLLILYGFSFLLSDASPEGPMTVSGSPPDPVTRTAVTWGALASSLMWISFSYAGYNAAIYVAGVASQGRRSVPRSMWLATLAVTAIYLGLNAIFLYVPPLEAIRGEKEIALIAARSLGGFWLGETVRGVVLVSLATSVLAMVQIGPHVYAQMARDRFLPGWLDTSQPTPRLGVLLQAFLAIFLILYADLLELLDYLAFLLSVSSAATAGCLLLPRFRGEPGDRPVWGWPWLPLCFIAATLAIAGMAFQYRLQSDPKSLLLALGILPLGGVIYAVARRWGGAGQTAGQGGRG